MGRLQPDFLDRIETLTHRIVDVADSLTESRYHKRVVDQLVGSGSSIGANLYEADEALSRKDFCKHIAIVIKELNETRFWLRFLINRRAIPPDRLAPLLGEAEEVKRVLGTILHRARQNAS